MADNKTLAMTRGDDVVLFLTPKYDGSPYRLEDGDIFRVKFFNLDGTILFSKVLTNRDQDADTMRVSVHINAADTQSLQLEEDTTYMWEGEVQSLEYGIFTPFLRRKMIIRVDKIIPGNRYTEPLTFITFTADPDGSDDIEVGTEISFGWSSVGGTGNITYGLTYEREGTWVRLLDKTNTETSFSFTPTTAGYYHFFVEAYDNEVLVTSLRLEPMLRIV